MNQQTLLPTTVIPEWMGSARYGVRPAPLGLALVQDFLNTRGGVATGPDLLGDATHAHLWVTNSVGSWSARRARTSEPPTLTGDDVAMMRRVRDTFDDALAGRPLQLLGAAEMTLTCVGEIDWQPSGLGWHWFYGALLSEVLLSRHTKTWQRLKQCGNNTCRATFYDSSWDNSAVWHNASTCDPAFAHIQR